MENKAEGMLAKTALFSAALIWGSSFFIMKSTLDNIPVYYLLTLRFATAAIILALIFIKRLRLFNFDYLLKGSVMGFFLFCAYIFQTFGLLYTTPGKNAFLTAGYCIIVPFLSWLTSGIRPGIHNVLSAIICVAGIGFVSLNETLSIGAGDALTLVCAFFYAAHIVAVARFSHAHDIFLLTIIQFASAAVLSSVCALLFDTFRQSIPSASLYSLLYLCLFATALALLLQNLGQKYTETSTAAIILSLEAVFAVLFSIVFYQETLTLRIALGFALIFGAVIISQLNCLSSSGSYKRVPSVQRK